MNEEARKALTRLGAKVRNLLGQADMVDSTEWDSLLFDLSAIERAFKQLETDHKIDVGKALAMATEEQILRLKCEAEQIPQPSVCPKCDGWGVAELPCPLPGTSNPSFVVCPVCLGAKVLYNFPIQDLCDEEVKELRSELKKQKEESNRSYFARQEYDVDIKIMRALLWDAHRDIMEWVRTARRIREEIDDPEHTPWCPHERGIQKSIKLAVRIGLKAQKGQGNAKN